MFSIGLVSKQLARKSIFIHSTRSFGNSSVARSNPNVPKVNESSTSALEYKDSADQGRIMPIPGVLDTLTVEQAVSNLIQSTPLKPRVAEERYLIDCLATDEPGVLSNVTGIMAARGFSIDTLVASKTEVPGLSRMTIGLKGNRESMERAKKQLEGLVSHLFYFPSPLSLSLLYTPSWPLLSNSFIYKFFLLFFYPEKKKKVPVWAVLDYSHTKIVERETLLVKVSLDGLEKFRPEYSDADSHSILNKFATSMERLSAIKNLAGLFRAQVVDVGPDSIIVEMSAKSERVDAFLKLIRPFGILEAVRSGVMVMARSIQGSRQFGSNPTAEEKLVVEEDLSNLPPS
ncbi:putative acetolactate synthase small subunit [Smittium mucronatum]|uniref:Putative acetolactate synthase small subunit n=1 Tax=Smittium mucronatum TaxID=133383 RepID=A0A1R0GR57_9FUNG|nr:putative acetolactate synthase small subunit [Smittium mucronatum]